EPPAAAAGAFRGHLHPLPAPLVPRRLGVAALRVLPRGLHRLPAGGGGAPPAARARLRRAGGRARLARARGVRLSLRPPPLGVRQPRRRPWLSGWWLAAA